MRKRSDKRSTQRKAGERVDQNYQTEKLGLANPKTLNESDTLSIASQGGVEKEDDDQE